MIVAVVVSPSLLRDLKALLVKKNTKYFHCNRFEKKKEIDASSEFSLDPEACTQSQTDRMIDSTSQVMNKAIPSTSNAPKNPTFID